MAENRTSSILTQIFAGIVAVAAIAGIVIGIVGLKKEQPAPIIELISSLDKEIPVAGEPDSNRIKLEELERGLKDLQYQIDTLIIIPEEKKIMESFLLVYSAIDSIRNRIAVLEVGNQMTREAFISLEEGFSSFSDKTRSFFWVVIGICTALFLNSVFSIFFKKP